MPYHSRRDEVGGTISGEEWNAFVDRLEGIIDKVKRKRKRIIRRRKKKGIKKLPRKTLFKPDKKVNLFKDPLWKEVFIEDRRKYSNKLYKFIKLGQEDEDVDDSELFGRNEEQDFK